MLLKLLLCAVVQTSLAISDCFPNLGCFKVNRSTPVWQRINPPLSPETIDPIFYYYDPNVTDGIEQEFYYTNLTNGIANLKTNGKKELWVLIHGFTEIWPRGWLYPMRDALLEKGHQILIIRWTKGSKLPNYFQSVANTKVVGAILARTLSILFESRAEEFDPKQTTLVGFSLGAHVAGFTGKRLRRKNFLIKKIFGLDPAGPGYSDVEPPYRLASGDAEFVQVLHTNAGLGLLGIVEPVGDVDFYANGGTFQPGCEPSLTDFRILTNTTPVALMLRLTCNHLRAPFLLVNSIREYCTFRGFSCSSPAKWFKGSCFNVHENNSTVRPEFGYSVDTKPDSLLIGQRFFFDTPAGKNDQKNLENFCGCQMQLSLTADSEVRGSLSVSLVSADKEMSPEVTILTMHQNELRVDVSKKIQFAVKTKLCSPAFLTFDYMMNPLWFLGGPRKWKIRNATLTRENGQRWETLNNIRVYDGSRITTRLFEI